MAEKLVFKFTATAIDQIEKGAGVPIENVISDSSIDSLARILQFTLFDDNKGAVGVSRSVALSKIDQYLEEGDKMGLTLDIMEGLVETGFLPRSINIQEARENIEKAGKAGLA